MGKGKDGGVMGRGRGDEGVMVRGRSYGEREGEELWGEGGGDG